MNFPKNVYENRELSWLKFNNRVLDEAKDLNNPLCERLSFISIFQSNLDEFVQVRVGSLSDRIKSDCVDNKTGLSCSEQIEKIREEQKKLLEKKDSIYKSLMLKLSAKKVKNLSFADLTSNEKKQISEYFKNCVQSFLSPQIVGKRQPFPFLRNKEIYAVVELEAKKNSNGTKLGIIPCFAQRRFRS